MRIVIDMQAAQSESRFRGIGRYTMEFAKAVARNSREHEVYLCLSDLFPHSVLPIREAFKDLLPACNIRVWTSPKPISLNNFDNEERNKVASILWTSFLSSLSPDVVHLCNVFEGFIDDAIAETPQVPAVVSVSHHDLIPLANPEDYLNDNTIFRRFYENKINHLKNADCLLCVSEFSKNELVKLLGAKDLPRVIVAENAVSTEFQAQKTGDSHSKQSLSSYGLKKSFLLTAGGFDKRKNLDELIRSYAQIPIDLRKNLQLVIAGRGPQTAVDPLIKLTRDLDLKPTEVVFPGYVPDSDLIGLYNLCTLFVFPSLHEGFGLPVLEAMACGAVPLVARGTAPQEIVGFDELTFNPSLSGDLTQKMVDLIQSPHSLSHYREMCLARSKAFSWDTSAETAITIWEKLHRQQISKFTDIQKYEELDLPGVAACVAQAQDDVLAEIAESIAQNSSAAVQRQLLLDVSELCKGDAGTGIQRVVRGYLKNLLKDPPRDYCVAAVYASLQHGYRYASTFQDAFSETKAQHPQKDGPIRWQRGDIFLALDCQHHVQTHHGEFFQELQSDGVIVKFIVYDLLPIQYPDLFSDGALPELHKQWLGMVAKSDGAICISQATADSLQEWITSNSVETSPYFRIESNHIGSDLKGSQPSTGRPANADAILKKVRAAPSFLCVSTIEPRKQQGLILSAVELMWGKGHDVNLVLVGRQGWKTEDLASYMHSHNELSGRLLWLEDVSDEFLTELYQACSCVILASLNEGFGLSLVEAASHGAPIIARDIPVFREIADEHAYFFDCAQPQAFAATLENWLIQFDQGIHISSEHLKPRTWQQSAQNLKELLLSPDNPKSQLMVDVSELVQHDAATGIQRVVKNVCSEWLERPPPGYRVELIYASTEHSYKYARTFTSAFRKRKPPVKPDDFVEFSSGDLFFGIDLQPTVQVSRLDQYQKMRRMGVSVKFFVHDLLPVTLPQFFPQGAEKAMSAWLSVVANSDGVLCNSRTTASEFSAWIRLNAPESIATCSVNYAYFGGDFFEKPETGQSTSRNESEENRAGETLNFLMVGTIEPRKGHAEVLDAFDLAWQRGMNVDLALVGKKGWLCENLERRIVNHPELSKRLRWLNHANDAELERLYCESDCLIVASYGEGFGLPIVEAAARRLPIVARDIPVFREIAGANACYFGGESGTSLLQTLSQWQELYEADQHPKSEDIELLTWRESAAKIFTKLL